MKPLLVKIAAIISILNVLSAHGLIEADDQSCLFQNCNCTYDVKKGYVIICDSQQAQTNGAFPSRNPSSNITNITQLSFSNYQFDKIPDGIFENLTLYELEFSNNGLQTIGEKAFQGVASLSKLALHEPSLQTIASGALSSGSFRIGSLDLSRSQLTNDRFNKLNEEIKNITTLLSLNLKENNLTVVDKLLLAGRTYALQMDFSFNQITDLDAEAFEDLMILRDLDLSNNRLSNFSSIIIAAKTIYQTLDLSNNLIENLDFQAPRNFAELNLANNRIKTIPKDIFTEYSRLLLLDLQSNQIDTIEPDALNSLENLSYLNLADNKIAKLPSFSNLLKLNSLNLVNQNNKLKKLEDYAFGRTYETYILNLKMSNNDLETYGDKAFCTPGSDYAKITRLSLSYVAMKNLNKCILKQLKSYRYQLILSIDQPSGSDISDVCTCDLYAFAKNEQLTINGACDPIFSGPTCQNTTYVDPCVGLDQYVCPSSSPTSTSSQSTTTTTIKTPTTTTSSALKSTKSSLSYFNTLILTTLIFSAPAF